LLGWGGGGGGFFCGGKAKDGYGDAGRLRALGGLQTTPEGEEWGEEGERFLDSPDCWGKGKEGKKGGFDPKCGFGLTQLGLVS